MNPIDALQQDWHLYYDGSWMRHKTLGPGQVVVSGNKLMFYSYPNDQPETQPKQCSATDLHFWWPRPGAINTPQGAAYVGRMATRSMRKSAHGEHFRILWSPPHFSCDKAQLMLWLRRGPSLVDVDFAKQALNSEMTQSVAVARDLILAASPKKGMYNVIYRGLPMGKLKDDVFLPHFPTAPVVRRCMTRLREERLI